MLWEFLLRDGSDRDVVAEQDRARRRGALIDSENKRHDISQQMAWPCHSA
jgi:hypothetical protein